MTPSAWRRAARRSFSIAAAAASALALTYALAAWHISNRIGHEALLAAYDQGPPACDDAVVESVGDSLVTLKGTGDDSSRVRRGPEWGLRWRGGWGTVGGVRAISAAGFTRAFLPGEGKLAPGAAVDLPVEPARSDPMRAAGLVYSDLSVESPVGPMPAWLVPGASDTWAVFVHGKGADRTQALRVLRDYADRGLPCLVITYRNDRGAPGSPDGRYHYGLTEWEDLDAACSLAVSRGAARFVLVGFSMGGGIVLSFLERSSLASRVVAVVLDAPVVDFGRTVDLGIHLARLPLLGMPLPPQAGWLGKRLASLRFGVNWREYALIDRADRLRAPILILHGDADDVVPFEGSASLAAARRDLVTLERFSGARHLESWNLERNRYRALVARFLATKVAR